MSEALAVHEGIPIARERQASARDASVPPVQVRQQLDRILASRAFARSPRISRFLQFVVEQTLTGQEDKLKEYLLGVEVFNRLDSFDPRIDSIVRVEARRLRYKLDKYYDTEGRDDTVYIQFRKGCYVPTFSNKRAGEDPGADAFAFPHLRTVENPHAFAHYAKGRHHLGRWTADGIAESISCLTHAIAEDRGCIEAHAALGGAWMLAGLMGLMPGRDVLGKARASAEEALSNGGCPEAHAIQAVASAMLEFEWAEAETRMRRAIPQDPSDRRLRLWYGLSSLLAGRFDDAIRELRKAQQADPASVTGHLATGFAQHMAQECDDALLNYKLAQELNPGFYAPHLAMGLLLTEQQMFEQAQHSLSQASQLSPRNPNVMAVLVYGHASAGRTDAARKVCDELSESAQRQYVAPICLSLAHAALKDRDAAIRKLEEAYEERSPWLGLVRHLRAFSPVRDDPRYPAFLARIGLA